MNILAIQIVALALAGLCDRVRGGYPEGREKWLKYLAMALVGPCLALQVTTSWPVLLAAVPAAFITMWRQDNGWRGRWVAGEKAYLKAMQWGAVASLSLLPLVYWDMRFVLAVPAFVMGSVIAQLIATRLPTTETLNLRHSWPWSELIELPIIGGLLLLFATFIPL